MLSRRQVTVQRENLTSMCRISVKCLLDYASLYTHVSDDSEEFINFCAVFEQLVSHRLQSNQKKTWLPGQGSPRHFWDVLLDNYHRTKGFLYQSCIPNIEAIETIKSPKAKLRAFIRVALMEKRLSDYLCWVMENKYLMRENYLDGAFMTSEEATLVVAELIGLNAIDFNFCLKGNENELLGPLEINYSPFLTYKQSSASQYSDEIEMLRLSGKDIDELKDTSSILTESNMNDVLRVQNLEKDMRQIKEQKDYLEELLRLRERQLTEASIRMESTTSEWQQAERKLEQERLTMEVCILELQKEMAKLQKSNNSLKAQVSVLKQYKQRTETKEVSNVEVATREGWAVDHSGMHVEMDSVWDRPNIPQAYSEQSSPVASDEQSEDPSLADRLSISKESRSQNDVKEQAPHTTTLGQHSSELVVREQVSQTAAPAHPTDLDVKDQISKYDIQNSATSPDIPESCIVADQAGGMNYVLSQGQEKPIGSGELAVDNCNSNSSVLSETEHSIPILPIENRSSAEFEKELNADLILESSALDSLILAGREQNFPVFSIDNCNNAEFEKEKEVLAEPEVATVSLVSSDSSDVA